MNEEIGHVRDKDSEEIRFNIKYKDMLVFQRALKRAQLVNRMISHFMDFDDIDEKTENENETVDQLIAEIQDMIDEVDQEYDEYMAQAADQVVQ